LFQINLALKTDIKWNFQKKLRAVSIILPVLTIKNANWIAEVQLNPIKY